MSSLKTLLALGLIGTTALAALSALAANDVRSQLTPDLIYEHCKAAGVGSEAEGTFLLPGGVRVTGTVFCTAEELALSKAADRRGRHNDDDDDD